MRSSTPDAKVLAARTFKIILDVEFHINFSCQFEAIGQWLGYGVFLWVSKYLDGVTDMSDGKLGGR